MKNGKAMRTAAKPSKQRRKRQLDGIARGRGRPVSIDPTRVRALKAQGRGATEIAKELGIGRASVYRALERESL